MTPQATEKDLLLEDNEKAFAKLVAPQADSWKFRVSYFSVAVLGFWHLCAVYGVYICLMKAQWSTIVFSYLLFVASIMGIMAGGHRLWAHKSYKAKLPLQIILIIFNSIGGQYSAYNWIRDHRLHHKYSDTDADPHNASRGFFFSHVGWLMVNKHPEIKKRGKSINMVDILNNRVVMFQKKYATPIITLSCFVLPTLIPVYFWNENLINAFHIMALRFVCVLNFVSLINSAAHAYGNRPYDKNIMSTENSTVTIATLGEGFHNYHHVFPWDYRAAELGNHTFNVTKYFIDFFAWVGWAYDLKTVDHEAVARRVGKTGDGSYSWDEGNDDDNKEDDAVIS